MLYKLCLNILKCFIIRDCRRSVFLNRRTAARYRAMASITPGRRLIKKIYRAAVSQRLRTTAVDHYITIPKLLDSVGFEILTAVVMKSSTFWDITLCSSLKVDRRFGETCDLHLQYRRISHARNQHQVRRNSCWLLLGLFFDPENRGDMFLQNVG
jgi:hypothetical protein